MARKTGRDKARIYYLRAKGSPKPVPDLTPEQRERARETAREVIEGMRAHLELVPDPDPPSRLVSAETGRVVLGSASMSEDEWREMVARHPAMYKIEPPLIEPPEV